MTPFLSFPLLAALMLALVGLIGTVVLHFTHHALAGRAERPVALRRVGFTIAGAMCVVLSPDLIGMAAAWTATSLALHQLLSLDPDRVGAQIAAHKKFILSRLADVVIWSGVITLSATFGTTSRSAVLAAAEAMPVLPTSAHVGVTLLAVGVLLRTAQLPFHGWLLQVMEAPTPFSALLHAGVVNLGVYVWISLAPLVARVPVAQGILIVSGTLTAVLAVLAMHTRANVKGVLAWSTIAQMGFVVLECGLGAYELAFLHLVAHALYKAHAFLRAGSAIRTQRQPIANATWMQRGTRALVAAGLMAGSVALTWTELFTTTHAPFTLVLLAAAILPWAALMPPSHGWRTPLTVALTAFGVPAFYAGWHALAAGFIPAAALASSLPLVAALPLIAFPAVAALSLLVVTTPQHALAQWLYPHAAVGFHLDDLFTRLTFIVWPPRRVVQRPTVRAAALATVIRRAA